MNAAVNDLASRKRAWYGVHVLAGLSLVLVVVVGAADIYQAATDQFPQLPTWAQVILLICMLALFWFWARMISDFFAVRPATHAAAWGWFLFLGLWFGALAYFWVIWRPRHRLEP